MPHDNVKISIDLVPRLKKKKTTWVGFEKIGYVTFRRFWQKKKKLDLGHLQCESSLVVISGTKRAFVHFFEIKSSLDVQKVRQASCIMGRKAVGGGGGPFHCTQKSTCSSLWECLDISSNSSTREGGTSSML